MSKFWLLIIACTLLAQGCATTPPPLLTEPAQEVTFVSAKPAPKSFTSWTFFWYMPEIAPDAELEYSVIRPDGKEYFRYKIGRRPAGYAIRSDFPPGLARTDPSVFFGKPVTVKFRVNKGTMKFTKPVSFAFETAVREIRAVRK